MMNIPGMCLVSVSRVVGVNRRGKKLLVRAKDERTGRITETNWGDGFTPSITLGMKVVRYAPKGRR